MGFPHCAQTTNPLSHKRGSPGALISPGLDCGQFRLCLVENLRVDHRREFMLFGPNLVALVPSAGRLPLGGLDLPAARIP